MGRSANPDIHSNYEEFADAASSSKCAKVKCKHCGYTRAKNTTRQIEHLLECAPYLASPDAQRHLADIAAAQKSVAQSSLGTPIRNANDKPTPGFAVNRRGPNSKRRSDAIHAPRPPPAQRDLPPPQPSLISYLLSTNRPAFAKATQQPFLSHAGCGTLSAPALAQWMAQDGHKARSHIQFVGGLIAKIRLPMGVNPHVHPLYRTLDLLISAVNNIRREMGFFENTASKYGIQIPLDPPSPVTRSYIDLFSSATTPSTSLLEGMVLLWMTGHVCRNAWQYASSFTSTMSGPATEAHIAALHQSLIPNWTSPAFGKFVDACGQLVDDLANSSTTANGREEMLRCDLVFKQVCWLEGQFWPDVNGMGEEADQSRNEVDGDDGDNDVDGEDEGSGVYHGALNGLSEAARRGSD